MQIKKLSMLVILASTIAAGTAIAQETDGSTDTEGTKTDRQRPDRDQARQRRDNMSDEDRQAARDKRQQRSGKSTKTTMCSARFIRTEDRMTCAWR